MRPEYLFYARRGGRSHHGKVGRLFSPLWQAISFPFWSFKPSDTAIRLAGLAHPLFYTPLFTTNFCGWILALYRYSETQTLSSSLAVLDFFQLLRQTVLSHPLFVYSIISLHHLPKPVASPQHSIPPIQIYTP